MESSYGVGVTNRFAIPDEEDVDVDDPTDILQSAEKKITEQKREVKKPAAKGKAAEKSQTKPASADKGQKGQSRGNDRQSQPQPRGERQDRGERGDRGRKPREGGERRPRREGGNRDSSQGGDFGTESSFGTPASFGESSSFGTPFGGGQDTRERGRGRGRGRGAPRGAPRDGHREFDRRSGSDRSNVRAQDKREGGGAHNWGNPVSTYEPTEEGAPAENGEGTAPAPKTTPEGEEVKGGDENAAPAPEDEDAKLLTLDEYKSMQQQSRFKGELNVRKAGENEDLTKWKNTSRYERPTAPTDEDTVEYVIEKKDQRSHSKQTVDLAFQFTAEPSSRGAPAPGGRRGGRGGGGRGDGREGGRGEDRRGEDRRGEDRRGEDRRGEDRRGDGRGRGGYDGGRGGRGGPSSSGGNPGGRREQRGGSSYNFRDDDFPALG